MRKLLLVAMLVMAVVCQNATVRSCKPYNAFQAHLSEKGLTMYETPKFGVKMCGAEFEKYGTCCDEKKIKDHVQSDRKQIKKATQKIVLEFENFMWQVPMILKLAKKFTSIKQKLIRKYRLQNQSQKDLNCAQSSRKLQSLPKANKHSNIGKAVSRPTHKEKTINSPTKRPQRTPNPTKPASLRKRSCSNRHSSLRRIVKRLAARGSRGNKKNKKGKNKTRHRVVNPVRPAEEMNQLLKKLIASTQAANFKKGTESCWNYIADLRASSVCSTCSGRGREFFSRNKALMSGDTCDSVLKVCYRPLRQITYFIIILNLLPEVIGLNAKISELADTKIEIDERLMEGLTAHLHSKELSGVARLFERANFIRLISKYETEKKLRGTEYFDQQRLFHAESNLCSRFMVLNQKPIIVQLKPLFATSSSQPNSAKSLIHEIHESIANVRSALTKRIIAPSWRVLSMVENNRNLQVQVNDVTGIHANSIPPVQVNKVPAIQTNSSLPVQTNIIPAVQNNSSLPVQANSSLPVQANSIAAAQVNKISEIQTNRIPVGDSNSNFGADVSVLADNVSTYSGVGVSGKQPMDFSNSVC